MAKREEIIEYLKANPAFLTEQQDLLEELGLNHSQYAVSFHERQIQVLKKREQQHQTRLNQLIDNAKANQLLESSLHQTAKWLLANCRESGHPSCDRLADFIEGEFKVDRTVILIEATVHQKQIKAIYPAIIQRVAHRGSVCDDRLPTTLKGSLFGSSQTPIKSCAFIPLTWQNKPKGVMVLGSKATDRFTPEMGVLFLDRLGELASTYLQPDLSN